MTVFEPTAGIHPLNLSVPAALWWAGASLLAPVLLYFIGVDQGAVSVLGSDTHVHEFIHDARHLLGFPCH